MSKISNKTTIQSISAFLITHSKKWDSFKIQQTYWVFFGGLFGRFQSFNRKQCQNPFYGSRHLKRTTDWTALTPLHYIYINILLLLVCQSKRSASWESAKLCFPHCKRRKCKTHRFTTNVRLSTEKSTPCELC